MPYVLAFRDAVLYYAVVPLWWYSEGLVHQLRSLGNAIREIDYITGFTVWLTHLFVPMYGQRDWQGRLISVFIRVTQIIIRGFLLVFLVVIRMALTALYILLPLVTVLSIFDLIVWPSR